MTNLEFTTLQNIETFMSTQAMWSAIAMLGIKPTWDPMHYKWHFNYEHINGEGDTIFDAAWDFCEKLF